MSGSGIVNLNDYGKDRRKQISVEHLRLLRVSRDMLAFAIAKELSGHAQDMQGNLLALSDNSPLAETREIYFQTLGILNRQGTELFQSCRQAINQTVGAQWGEVRAQAVQKVELSLMDDTDYEVTLALNKSSSRLSFNCAEELVGLEARMGALLGRGGLSADENPLGPKLLCEALLDGMKKLDLEQKTQLVLLSQFDLVLYTELPAIYQEINRFLLGKGVLPDFKAGTYSRPEQAARPKLEQSEQREGGQNDLLKLFERMANQVAAAQGGAAAGGVAGQAGVPGGAGGGAALLGFGMLEALNRLQTGALSLPGGVTVDLRGSLSGGFPNVVRELQQSPAMQAANHVDAVMIDAVAMLFDYLFEDRAIPDHLKQLIAQLQVPVLKAAIIDRSFFTNREHPARQVLDLIAALAVRPGDAEEGQADPLRAEVEKIIEKIVNEYGQDDNVFVQAAELLTELQSRREQEVEASMTASMADSIQALQKEERTQVADSVVREYVRRALADQPAQEDMALFLRDHWAVLLRQEFIEGGESSPRLTEHMETMRELLWSVQPKPDADGRNLLLKILPGLLKRLRAGVAETGMSTEDSDRFFACLVEQHASVIRVSALSVALPNPEELDDLLGQDDGEHSAGGPAGFGAAEAETEDEFSSQARGLRKGDRVEMQNDDGTARWMQVVWVSDLRSNLMLADANGLNLFSTSPERLAEKLRAGQARLLGKGELATESAFSKLFSFFKQRAGAA